MKNIKQFLEGRHHFIKRVDKSKKKEYSCQPKTRDELFNITRQRIKKEGPNCDLNDIDTFKIDNMKYLFANCPFNGDISEWDVSNVTSMDCMFEQSQYTGDNGDISDWDVSSVENMSGMFYKSMYNGDISDWDVSSVNNMESMFDQSVFTSENGDISDWDVSNVTNMRAMFARSKYDGDISNWDTSSVQNMQGIFFLCPVSKNPPKWIYADNI